MFPELSSAVADLASSMRLDGGEDADLDVGIHEMHVQGFGDKDLIEAPAKLSTVKFPTAISRKCATLKKVKVV